MCILQIICINYLIIVKFTATTNVKNCQNSIIITIVHCIGHFINIANFKNKIIKFLKIIVLLLHLERNRRLCMHIFQII